MLSGGGGRGDRLSNGHRSARCRLAITGANSTLGHTWDRSPTVADIAGHLGISEDDVIEGLEGARAYNSTSLSTPISEGALNSATPSVARTPATTSPSRASRWNPHWPASTNASRRS